MPDTELPWLLSADAMVGQMRVIRPLGRDGMAEVCLARDTRLGRKGAGKSSSVQAGVAPRLRVVVTASAMAAPAGAAELSGTIWEP